MHHQHHEGLKRQCNLFLLGVGVLVDERKGKTKGREQLLEVTVYLRAGKRTDCSCGQALEAEGFELLRGALFYPWQGPVVGFKRAPHMGCTMSSVEGMRENRLQRVSVEVLELPDSKWHSTWGA